MPPMANLRIIHLNVADLATLTATSTAGSLVAANMQRDTKLQVHRSVGTSVSYTLTWAQAQQVGGVALPATNLTSAATVRVRLYSDAEGTALISDSGVRPACPTGSVGLLGWGGPINANAFAFGGASKVAVWFAGQPATVRRCVVDLSDPQNPAGYVDCARIVCGPFWEAPVNPQYGATFGVTDQTKTQRADSGDMLVTRGAQFESMSFDLAYMTEQDRAQLAKVFRSAGSYRNLFVSALPEMPLTTVQVPGQASNLSMSGDPVAYDEQLVGVQTVTEVPQEPSLEQDLMIYGRRASGPFKFDFFNSFSTRVEIEGW